MLILGVDTSSKHGSIALVRFDSDTSQPKAFRREGREEQPQSSQRTASQTLEMMPLEGGTFSAKLMPQIAALLQKHGLTKQQIDGFAVVSGPGSFTGLRVGLAAIKALAEILQKPIAAVSLLEAVAIAAGNGQITAVIDAGRGEVYVGKYDVHDGRATVTDERLLTAVEFGREMTKQHVVTPDHKLAEPVRGNGNTVEWLAFQPKADSIARFGFQKIQAGETISPEALDATYIRRSEAEIKFAERPK